MLLKPGKPRKQVVVLKLDELGQCKVGQEKKTEPLPDRYINSKQESRYEQWRGHA
jgi:hypothetical protein